MAAESGPETFDGASLFISFLVILMPNESPSALNVSVRVALAAALSFGAWCFDAKASDGAYRVTPGDRLAVAILGQTELSGEYSVDLGGNLRLPLVGNVPAANLLLGDLEKAISSALEQGYLQHPVVSVRVLESRPIHVIGLVRSPGIYPFRQGVSVLGAIAQAGGIGAAEGRHGALIAELLQAEERVSMLEIRRLSLLAKRARLTAQQDGSKDISFREVLASVADPAALEEILEGERRIFHAERQAERQEMELLESQIPRLRLAIASLNDQLALEQQQGVLNKELADDYERLMKSGLGRKPTYIEMRREDARIEGNIARVKSETLKTELAVGDVEFKMGELRNTYRRRVIIELQAVQMSLLELGVELPAAQRARASRAQQIGILPREDMQRPSITVIRVQNNRSVQIDASLELTLHPGDIVQVGSVFPAPAEAAASPRAGLAQGETENSGTAIARPMSYRELGARSTERPD